MTTTSWLEIAQPSCADPVVAAGRFKPNARGTWEFASLGAMSERQLLKGIGNYFAEKVLLAVTTVEIVAIDRGLTGIIRSHMLTWRRDELVVRLVAMRSELEGLPAFTLARGSSWPRIEVAPTRDDDATHAVIDELLTHRPSASSGHRV